MRLNDSCIWSISSRHSSFLLSETQRRCSLEEVSWEAIQTPARVKEPAKNAVAMGVEGPWLEVQSQPETMAFIVAERAALRASIEAVFAPLMAIVLDFVQTVSRSAADRNSLPS